MNRHAVGKSYLTVATRTASPGQLVLMLYEGAVRFLECALHGFTLEDPAESNSTINNNIQRAQAILQELDAALDLERGGDLASHLRGIYLYLDRRLNDSNLRKEPEGIRESIARLSTLRDAWREMLTRPAPNTGPALVELTALG